MNTKPFGIIGLAIPTLFLIGMIVFYSVFNPESLVRINTDPFILYTMPEIPGSIWMAFFNQVFIGLLMLAFTIFLLRKTDNSLPNLIGKILLLTSSTAWIGNGLMSAYINDRDTFLKAAMVLTFFVVVCGSAGFIIISSEFERIIKRPRYKKMLLACGVLVLAEATIHFVLLGEYPKIISKIAWLIYFVGFGIIGHGIFTKRS